MLTHLSTFAQHLLSPCPETSHTPPTPSPHPPCSHLLLSPCPPHTLPIPPIRPTPTHTLSPSPSGLWPFGSVPLSNSHLLNWLLNFQKISLRDQKVIEIVLLFALWGAFSSAVPGRRLSPGSKDSSGISLSL